MIKKSKTEVFSYIADLDQISEFHLLFYSDPNAVVTVTGKGMDAKLDGREIHAEVARYRD